MSETPHIDDDIFMSRAAEIARKPAFIIPTGLVVAGMAAFGLASHAQEQQRQANVDRSVERSEQGAEYFKAIAEISEQPAILETASNVFEVQGIDLYNQSLNELETIPEFETDYKENKDLIDATLLESTKSLSVYHEGDNIAITRLETDADSAVYITQFVTEDSLSLTANEWTIRLGNLSAEVPETKIPETVNELPSPTTR